MEIILPTAFTFPAATKINAMIMVTTLALKGSLLSPLPFAKKFAPKLKGNVLSEA
jgi:hypothetical protein